MKKCFFMLMIWLSFFTSALAEPVDVKLSPSANQLNLLESSPDYFKLEYILGTFQLEEITIEELQYNSIKLKGESNLLLKGKPDLPKVTRSVSISKDAVMEVKILESSYVELPMNVAPSKGSIPRNKNPGTLSYEFSEVYSQDQFYPSSDAYLGEPYIFRDLRGITINLCPVTFNPVSRTIRVYTRMVIEIFNTAPSKKMNTTEEISPNATFKEIYGNHFLNYTSRRYADIDEAGGMLVICADDFLEAMQPFVEWKNQKGIPTAIVGVNQVGNHPEQIKEYILSQYLQKDLSFVLLVGDSSEVRAYAISDMDIGTASSDAAYALLAGSDYYPEIIVGRFSAETEEQVKVQVAKTIFHERDLGEESWRYKGIGFASAEGPGDDYEMDYEHMRNIRRDLLNYQYTQVDEFYEGTQGGMDKPGNPSQSMSMNALNEGRGIVNYIGHGDYTMWLTGGLTNSAVNRLNNTNKMPIIFSVACVVGGFGKRTCFAESWLRAGSESNLTGGVAMYGASIFQPWVEPMRAQDEFIDLLAAETKASFGALCYTASARMLDEGGEAPMTFLGWVIFGDPSLQVNSTGPTPTPVQVPLKGDVDNNSRIDVVDSLKIAQFYVGLAPAEFDEGNADANCDGQINIIDALIVAQFYINLISELCS